jgi:hypothetical protein
MVMVRGEKVSVEVPREAQDQGRRVQTDGSATVSRSPGPGRAADHACEWPRLHTRSMSANICIPQDPANAAPAIASVDTWREWPKGCASLCWRFLRHACRLSPRLMEDTHNLSFKFPEFDGHHKPSRMQDEIEPRREQIHMPPQSLAHAPLDAIAFMRFAQHFARGQTHARPGRERSTGVGWPLPRHKPAHRCGLTFAADRIGTLIVGMSLQAHAGQRLNRSSNRRLNRGSRPSLGLIKSGSQVAAGSAGHAIADYAIARIRSGRNRLPPRPLRLRTKRQVNASRGSRR